jgi:hypothetical protein
VFISPDGKKIMSQLDWKATAETNSGNFSSIEGLMKEKIESWTLEYRGTKYNPPKGSSIGWPLKGTKESLKYSGTAKPSESNDKGSTLTASVKSAPMELTGGIGGAAVIVEQELKAGLGEEFDKKPRIRQTIEWTVSVEEKEPGKFVVKLKNVTVDEENAWAKGAEMRKGSDLIIPKDNNKPMDPFKPTDK